ncbi:MAG: hypothetical protein V4488_17680 [Pseudomonadota bacterium]
MQFSNEPANPHRPLVYLALVAAFHVAALYLLLSQGILQRKHSRAEQVVYMDLRNLALPRPAPPKPADSQPAQVQVQAPVAMKRTSPKPPTMARKMPDRPDAAIDTGLSSAPPSAPSTMTQPEAPRLDLDKLRQLARHNERGRQLTPAEQLRAAQQADQSIEAKIDTAAKKAQRSDCRTAHADTGLLAPLFMLKDAITDKGCKW